MKKTQYFFINVCTLLIRNYTRSPIFEKRFFFIIIAISISVHALAHVTVKFVPNTHGIGNVIKQNIVYISLYSDISFQSFVMYFFEILTTFGFFVSFLLTKKKFLLLFSIFSTFIFVDDFFNVHGNLGGALSEKYALPVFVNLREVDTGEMLVWLSAGFLLMLLFPYCLRKLQIREQAFCAIYFCLFFLLIICGIIADMLHIATTGAVSFLIGIFEDGGELAVISAICFLSLSKFKRHWLIWLKKRRGSSK